MENKTFHVVVLGAGFGGLEFCKHFHRPNARITLVDRTNHHLFQPLLYQVATAGLSAPEIAQPVRAIFSNRKDITVLLDKVVDFDLTNKKVLLEENTLTYDFLVVALGSCVGYFGHPEWEKYAPGLKTLEDAVRIRAEVLLAFEHLAHLEPVGLLVALRPWRPHRRPSRRVQQAELNADRVRDFAHDPAERVDFAYQVTFGNAAHGRVARHLRDQVNVQREQRGAQAHASGSH